FIRQAIGIKTTASLRWNAVSTAVLSLKDTHPVLSDLLTEPGARCALWMATVNGNSLTRRRLLEGRVGEISGEGSPFGTIDIPVADDFDDLGSLLGWQVPGAPATGQGAAEYWRMTAPSDTRALAAIAANAARLSRPWDVAPSEGLGTSAPVELRMDALAESIIPPLIADRLQLTIGRDRATNRWDVAVRPGELFARPVTPQSGVLKQWAWVNKPATATRAIVGGRGDGTARQFLLVVDEALEAEMGTQLEIFVDARNAEEGADLEPYGRAALAKHAASAGFTAALQEASWFRYAETFELGDRLPVKVGALEFEDVISQVDITHDTRSGFVVVPTVGIAPRDPQSQLIEYVRDMATAVREIERR
ncbi:MAG: ArV2, partial [Microbacterium sp.]|nr:ArV2 [Microbacterium sp.]